MEGTISKKALAVWELAACLAAAVLAAAIWLLLPDGSFFWYLLLWLTGFCLVLCAFLYLPLRYENEYYCSNEDYVEYQRGLIIFTRTRILKRAVLYVSVVRTPLSLVLNTRTVVVCSMGARMAIPFLPVKDAEALLAGLTPHSPALQPRIFDRKGRRHA